jgi:hypothetical protein
VNEDKLLIKCPEHEVHEEIKIEFTPDDKMNVSTKCGVDLGQYDFPRILVR